MKKNLKPYLKRTAKKIFQEIKSKLEWINIKTGEVLLFNQSLPHGNRVNLEKDTRWSLNCRFKSIFSPYGDKKIGEFFQPITLKKFLILEQNIDCQILKMKKIRGYIFSRPFMGERAPQHVQNIVIKDFCKSNSLEYLLSVSEYKMEDPF